jgi:hypothetical protein
MAKLLIDRWEESSGLADYRRDSTTAPNKFVTVIAITLGVYCFWRDYL